MTTTQAQSPKRRFRFEKIRMPVAWIGGIYLFLTASPNARSFAVGIPVAMLGMALRAWASGYIEKKEKVLADNGPFAHVRNPLYAGSFLLGLGIVIIVNSILALAVFLAGFVTLYLGTVRKEERKLEEKLGEPYRRYRAAVPRFFPRWTPYPERTRTRFQWRLLLQHRELETLFAVLLIITGLYLWKGMVLEGRFGAAQWLALGLGTAWIAGLIWEKRLRRMA